MNTHQTTTTPAERRPADASDDPQLEQVVRHAAMLRRGFYLVVLLVALTGQVSGAVTALHIPLWQAIPAVGALELGGVVVLTNADIRRRLGERALGSRLLSAAIAAGAVTFSWLTHPDPLLGGFFAGMSALGYLVWLTHAGNSRRDRLRAHGTLPPTTPAYELLGHWLLHPRLTHRAKTLAKTNSALGVYESINAARSQIDTERRRTAIAKVLHREIRAAVDPATADIAIAVYNLDTIAERLTHTADYDGLTALMARNLTAAHLSGAPAHQTSGPGHPQARGSAPAEAPSGTQVSATAPAGTSAANVAATRLPAPAADAPTESLEALLLPPPARVIPEFRTEEVDNQYDELRMDTADRDDAVPAETAAAVAYWQGRNPELRPGEIADRIGRSERTVRRHLRPLAGQ